jgi:spermidine/putrescine transport system substrate-binding protein
MLEDNVDRLVERMLEGDEHSRRQFLRRLAALSLTAGPASTLLAACGGVKGTAQKQTTTAVAVNHPKVAITELDFSNWPYYIDKKKEILRDFERKYGGHVKYVEEINDVNEFFGKVRQQLQRRRPIGRDIVVLTDPMPARWIRNGFVTPIDKKNIPNVVANLQDNLRHPAYDPNRSYAIPWQSGMDGIGYDPKRTGFELKSVNDLFDPRLKGRVTMLADPHDSASLVLLGMGKKTEDATLDDMLGAIEKIDQENRKGQIRKFTGNDYTADLARGNTWAAVVYSGDVSQLKDSNPRLEFVIPEEGAVYWTDNMMMPAKAAHPYAAETMMNYVYDPAVAAKLAEAIAYISPVKGAQQILEKNDPKLASSPLVFPDAATRAKLHPYPNLSTADDQKMLEAMSKVTGQ